MIFLTCNTTKAQFIRNTNREIGDLKLEAIISESCKEGKGWKLRLNLT